MKSKLYRRLLLLFFVFGSSIASTAQSYSSPTGKDKYGHGYVDLGLSVKWATCNIGASTPTGYGNYYAWGEDKPKTSYTAENSKNYGIGILESIVEGREYPVRDAAESNWKGRWRLPSSKEAFELCSKCTAKWTTIKGVNGILLTSDINGRSIFLPAAGHREGTSFIESGESGLYWTSTCNYGKNKAYDAEEATMLCFSLSADPESSDLDISTFGKYPKWIGMPVRPVYDLDEE